MYIFWYVWCLNGWAHICEKKKWKQVTSPECFCIGTRQSVPDSPSVFTLTHGKDWDFAVCLPDATRQIRSLCRVPSVNGTRQTRRHVSFFLPSAFWALGQTFAECPIKDTRQSRLCRLKFRRVIFAECRTRQIFCRVQNGLCRVPRALGKEGKSGSVKGHK